MIRGNVWISNFFYSINNCSHYWLSDYWQWSVLCVSYTMNVNLKENVRVHRLWCLIPPCNISITSWRSVLLLEETGVPGENNRQASSHWQTFITKLYWVRTLINVIIIIIHQGCEIALTNSSASYVEHVGQEDFPGTSKNNNPEGIIISY